MILRGGHRLVFRGGSVGARIEETQYVEDTELAMVPAGVDAVARIDWECEVGSSFRSSLQQLRSPGYSHPHSRRCGNEDSKRPLPSRRRNHDDYGCGNEYGARHIGLVGLDGEQTFRSLLAQHPRMVALRRPFES